jgi:hypothetical protein
LDRKWGSSDSAGPDPKVPAAVRAPLRRTRFNWITRPDGLGVWEEAGDRVVLCLEYDRSTDSRSTARGSGTLNPKRDGAAGATAE